MLFFILLTGNLGYLVFFAPMMNNRAAMCGCFLFVSFVFPEIRGEYFRLWNRLTAPGSFPDVRAAYGVVLCGKDHGGSSMYARDIVFFVVAMAGYTALDYLYKKPRMRIVRPLIFMLVACMLPAIAFTQDHLQERIQRIIDTSGAKVGVGIMRLDFKVSLVINEAYLSEMLAEKNIRYSKKNPNGVVEKYYLTQVAS